MSRWTLYIFSLDPKYKAFWLNWLCFTFSICQNGLHRVKLALDTMQADGQTATNSSGYRQLSPMPWCLPFLVPFCSCNKTKSSSLWISAPNWCKFRVFRLICICHVPCERNSLKIGRNFNSQQIMYHYRWGDYESPHRFFRSEECPFRTPICVSVFVAFPTILPSSHDKISKLDS